VWEERTDCGEAPAADEPRRGASRRFRLRHPQGRSEAEDPGGRSPEGLREAKGAIRLTGLRTEDVRDWARPRWGPVAAACRSYRATRGGNTGPYTVLGRAVLPRLSMPRSTHVKATPQT